MIKFLYTILTSSNPNILFYKVLLLLFILFVLYSLINKHKWRTLMNHEGFVQNERFVLKTEHNIYDDFYSEIHDKIHLPEERVGFELLNIIKMTEPSSQNSVFLDIGSGTGSQVNELKEAGYVAYGLDKSRSMVKKSEKKYPKCDFKCGDAMESMAFEKGTFTHILCTYFTIYHFKDKRTFFRNVYHWLMPNGYLILHLVDPKKFDSIAPIGKVSLQTNPFLSYEKMKNYESSRITDTIVEFPAFQYKSEYQFNENMVKVKETFKDTQTANIRQNEQTLYMEPIKDILNIAASSGYVMKAMIDMKKCINDENQFIYILEKI